MKFQFLENIADKRVTYTKCLFTFASLYRSHGIIPDDTHTHKKTEDTYTSKLIVILRRLFLHQTSELLRQTTESAFVLHFRSLQRSVAVTL